VVCACPEGELHEGGLLAFAVHAAASGWEVVYLGANTPLAEALHAVAEVRASVLALSLTIDSPARSPAKLIAALRKPTRALRVLAGGRAALAHRDSLERAGVAVADHVGIDLPSVRGLARTA